jgi:hypothetical protein
MLFFEKRYRYPTGSTNMLRMSKKKINRVSYPLPQGLTLMRGLPSSRGSLSWWNSTALNMSNIYLKNMGCFGWEFIDSGSGSSILGWIPILIRPQIRIQSAVLRIRIRSRWRIRSDPKILAGSGSWVWFGKWKWNKNSLIKLTISPPNAQFQWKN